jgi:hypothetical protein
MDVRHKIAPSDLEEHARQCTAFVVPCAAHDVGCQWRGKRLDLHGHASKCTFVKNRPVLRRVAALEAANRTLEEQCMILQARVSLLEGVENR